MVEIVIEVWVQLLARVGGCWVVGGGWTKTKLMLNSTQVEVKVEVGVELGNYQIKNYECQLSIYHFYSK